MKRKHKPRQVIVPEIIIKNLSKAFEQAECFKSPRTAENLWNAGEKFLKKTKRWPYFFIPKTEVEEIYIFENEGYSFLYSRENWISEKFNFGYNKRIEGEIFGYSLGLVKNNGKIEAILTY